jgi:hypothetical protein
MIFFIIFVVAIWGFSSDAPDLVKVFSWGMALPIFIMTLIDMMMGG